MGRLRQVKRFVADWLGNMVFFCPLVIAFNYGWSQQVINHYLLASIPIAAVGGRGYALFLKYFWYPAWKEQF